MTFDELKKLCNYDDPPEIDETEDWIYEGLTILKKYHPYAGRAYVFKHDQMWVDSISVEDYLKTMSDEDAKRMVELGWFVSEDLWSHI